MEILQDKQFRALGLSATGDEIVPGVDNLAKRLNSVLKQVGSGDLDISSKLATQLKEARNLIKTEGDKLTKDTRAKINEFIKAANGGDAHEKLKGPLTATSSLNVNKVLDGLGLNRDLEKELKARLSSVNSAGVSLAGAVRPSGNFSTPAIVVENHNTTTLDGQVVAKSVTRSQQKTGRRNPKSKRGTRHGV